MRAFSLFKKTSNELVGHGIEFSSKACLVLPVDSSANSWSFYKDRDTLLAGWADQVYMKYVGPTTEGDEALLMPAVSMLEAAARAAYEFGLPLPSVYSSTSNPGGTLAPPVGEVYGR